MQETKQDIKKLPLLPLRDMVIFPGMIVPLFVGRDKSINALEAVIKDSKQIILVTQKDPEQDAPDTENIYQVGVVATILQLLRLPDGTIKVLVEANFRVKISNFTRQDKFYEAQYTISLDPALKEEELMALHRALIESFLRYGDLNKRIQPEVLNSVSQITDTNTLINTIFSNLNLRLNERQEILEIDDVGARIEKVLSYIEREIGVLSTESKIRDRVKKQMEKTQREYYLNEQMKAIQKELNDGDDDKNDIKNYEEKIKKIKLSKEAKEQAQYELKKLKSMSAVSAEANVVRSYLDWLLGIPWNNPAKLKSDINKAQETLNIHHSGLEKVKERVIEYLAVQKKTNALKGPIVCFIGPPGVGKTSLAKSIADATGRSFIKISLGGVRDEAEIRGHRRTYIGAMPGKIIQAMKKAKSSNPLILLDELDKMGNDFRGDPAAALLEVLDPEQNNKFGDHYLEVEYDLSQVMFIATANSYNISRPLLDRLEIIRVSGYTEEEKIAIANEHLISKELEKHGLKKTEISITDEALKKIIQNYTRESGVRNLEREIAKLCRKVATKIVKKQLKRVAITADNLKDYLGVERFDYTYVDKDDRIGVVNGLAYTDFGGDILPIEVLLIPSGVGKITLTGKLGDVMQESAQAAWSYVRSKSHSFGIVKKLYKKNDIHIHVPEGATPKDGPSAGAAIATAIVSALTGIPVRRDIAMTGEISLRGMVLPIGGLKEKLLAALRSGIKKVLIPEKNLKDLQDIPENVKSALEIVPVSVISDVIKHALVEVPKVINPEDDKEEEVAKGVAISEEDKDGKVVRH